MRQNFRTEGNSHKKNYFSIVIKKKNHCSNSQDSTSTSMSPQFTPVFQSREHIITQSYSNFLIFHSRILSSVIPMSSSNLLSSCCQQEIKQGKGSNFDNIVIICFLTQDAPNLHFNQMNTQRQKIDKSDEDLSFLIAWLDQEFSHSYSFRENKFATC